jgi:hypothetical protein
MSGFKASNYALAELALLDVATGQIVARADGRTWLQLPRLHVRSSRMCIRSFTARFGQPQFIHWKTRPRMSCVVSPGMKRLNRRSCIYKNRGRSVARPIRSNDAGYRKDDRRRLIPRSDKGPETTDGHTRTYGHGVRLKMRKEKNSERFDPHGS